MKPAFFLAQRYLNTRQSSGTGERSGNLLSFASLVAFVSVMLGSMALILALAILGGFERELRENAVKFTAHIEITGFGKRLLPNAERVLATLPEKVPNIRQISMFIAAEGIARSSSFMDGVLAKGIIPERDVTGIRSTMKEGVFAFSSGEAREIIIGKKLAQKLTLGLGKKMTLYSIRGDLRLNAPIVEQFTIVGIYETGMSEYDDLYVYVPFEAARTIFGIPKGATSGFDILVHDITAVKQTASAIEDVLGYPYFVQTIFELYDAMFAWIELQKQPVPIILGLISIVAVFNIVATLFMAVVQRISAIGILRTLGMNQRSIVAMFLYQGLSIGAFGTLTGCALGAILCWVQHDYKLIALKGEIYFLNAVPIEFSVWHYAVVAGVSIALSGFAALIPAVVGSKVRVLRALQFQ